MATLITNLSIISQDYLTDPLSLKTSFRVDKIADPKEFSTKTIQTSPAVTLMTANTLYSYFYIKVLSAPSKSNYITLTLGSSFSTKLRINELVFLPLDNTTVVKAQAVLGPCKVEYGYWSKATA